MNSNFKLDPDALMLGFLGLMADSAEEAQKILAGFTKTSAAEANKAEAVNSGKSETSTQTKCSPDVCPHAFAYEHILRGQNKTATDLNARVKELENWREEFERWREEMQSGLSEFSNKRYSETTDNKKAKQQRMVRNFPAQRFTSTQSVLLDADYGVLTLPGEVQAIYSYLKENGPMYLSEVGYIAKAEIPTDGALISFKRKDEESEHDSPILAVYTDGTQVSATGYGETCKAPLSLQLFKLLRRMFCFGTVHKFLNKIAEAGSGLRYGNCTYHYDWVRDELTVIDGKNVLMSTYIYDADFDALVLMSGADIDLETLITIIMEEF